MCCSCVLVVVGLGACVCFRRGGGGARWGGGGGGGPAPFPPPPPPPPLIGTLKSAHFVRPKWQSRVPKMARRNMAPTVTQSVPTSGGICVQGRMAPGLFWLSSIAPLWPPVGTRCIKSVNLVGTTLCLANPPGPRTVLVLWDLLWMHKHGCATGCRKNWNQI